MGEAREGSHTHPARIGRPGRVFARFFVAVHWNTSACPGTRLAVGGAGSRPRWIKAPSSRKGLESSEGLGVVQRGVLVLRQGGAS